MRHSRSWRALNYLLAFLTVRRLVVFEGISELCQVQKRSLMNATCAL